MIFRRRHRRDINILSQWPDTEEWRDYWLNVWVPNVSVEAGVPLNALYFDHLTPEEQSYYTEFPVTNSLIKGAWEYVAETANREDYTPITLATDEQSGVYDLTPPEPAVDPYYLGVQTSQLSGDLIFAKIYDLTDADTIQILPHLWGTEWRWRYFAIKEFWVYRSDRPLTMGVSILPTLLSAFMLLAAPLLMGTAAFPAFPGRYPKPKTAKP